MNPPSRSNCTAWHQMVKIVDSQLQRRYLNAIFNVDGHHTRQYVCAPWHTLRTRPDGPAQDFSVYVFFEISSGSRGSCAFSTRFLLSRTRVPVKVCLSFIHFIQFIHSFLRHRFSFINSCILRILRGATVNPGVANPNSDNC